MPTNSHELVYFFCPQITQISLIFFNSPKALKIVRRTHSILHYIRRLLHELLLGNHITGWQPMKLLFETLDKI